MNIPKNFGPWEEGRNHNGKKIQNIFIEPIKFSMFPVLLKKHHSEFYFLLKNLNLLREIKLLRSVSLDIIKKTSINLISLKSSQKVLQSYCQFFLEDVRADGRFFGCVIFVGTDAAFVLESWHPTSNCLEQLNTSTATGYQ